MRLRIHELSINPKYPWDLLTKVGSVRNFATVARPMIPKRYLRTYRYNIHRRRWRKGECAAWDTKCKRTIVRGEGGRARANPKIKFAPYWPRANTKLHVSRFDASTWTRDIILNRKKIFSKFWNEVPIRVSGFSHSRSSPYRCIV